MVLLYMYTYDPVYTMQKTENNSCTYLDMKLWVAQDMLPPATDMDMLLPATDMDMLLPELPMVDMLFLAMGMDMLLLSYGYRYASTRTSYDGYAPPSYRYSYGGYASPSDGYRHVLILI